MLTADEERLFHDFQKAFKHYYQGEVINVDEKTSVKLDYVVVRFEDILPALNYSAPPHRVSDYRIIYIREGDGETTVGSIKLLLKNHTLIAIPARAVSSGSFAHNVKGYHLGFNLEFFWLPYFPSHHLLKLELLDSVILPYAYLDDNEAAGIEHIFETLLDEHHHDRKNKEELVALKILQLMVLCDRYMNNSNGLKRVSTTSPVITKFLDLLELHFREHHSPAYYARELHLHPNSLNATTRRYLGRTAKGTIDAMLLSEAKSLLVNTKRSVKEIAYELGFATPSLFFRFFKRTTGASPGVYRVQHI